MTKEPRYKAKIKADLIAKESLLDMLQISAAKFFWIEHDLAEALLKNYFDGLENTRALKAYSTQLRHNKAHNFWPWFLNQKRDLDKQILHELKYDFEECGYTSSHARLCYIDELRAWVNQSDTHERLRYFLTQSPTLYTL
jgi:hypothetical protein